MQPILVSQSQPMAAMTGGVKLALAADERESATERFRFNRSIDLVALVVTVSLSGVVVGGRRDATLDDLEIRLEGHDFRPTRDLSDDNDSDTFVDAKSLTLPLRYLGARAPGAPDIPVQVRWKNFVAGTPIYNNVLVAVTVLYNPAEG